MSRLTRGGTAEPVSQTKLSGSADHEQDWKPHPVVPNSDATCDEHVVVVVVVFTLKTVLTSIQYPSLSYSSRQRNEFPWSHANPK